MTPGNFDRRASLAALDNALFDMMAEKLYAAVISDILDSLGFRHQVLQPGVVPAKPDSSDVVVSGVGGMTNVAVWGELFSNAAKARGARGFLTDGCHRDTRMVLDLGFPVFSRGARPVDISGRGTVISIGRPVEVAGVIVRPGDVVFAEVDGVVFIPEDMAEKTVSRSLEKVAKEDGACEDLRAGRLLSEVWSKYRVL